MGGKIILKLQKSIFILNLILILIAIFSPIFYKIASHAVFITKVGILIFSSVYSSIGPRYDESLVRYLLLCLEAVQLSYFPALLKCFSL
jgi:hypothetical protein